MHILVFSYFYPPFVGGTENIAQAGVEGLAANGHQITVLTSAAPGKSETLRRIKQGRVKIISLPYLHPFRDESEALAALPDRLHRLFAHERFDGVHAHLLTYPWAPARSACLLHAFAEYGIPVVDQAHGGTPERDVGTCLKLLDLIDGMIADSLYAKQLIENLAGAGAKLPEIQVLYPSIVSPTAFNPDTKARARTRRQLGVGEEEMLVFFPSRFFDIDGTLSVSKRPLAALNAFAELRRSGSKSSRLLTIMPPGFWTKESETEARKQVSSLMHELDIEDSTVVVNKRVSHSEMPALYQAADVTLVPSREGFGLVYLESMACGVPVVGVSEGASVEVVGDEGGVLVPPGSGFEQRLGQALVKLEADAAHRQTLGRSGYRVFVEKHNPEQWVERLEAILSAAFHR